MCKCPRGFVGPDCGINVNDCEKNECANGSKCIDMVNGYTCQCPPGT